jgi:DNA-binding transcriptional ArsR family regulator
VPEHLDSVLSAISDPTRRGILAQLSEHGPARISSLAASFPMSLAGFCKHITVLEEAGLVTRTRHGRENTIAFSPKPLQEVARWVLQYEPFWNAKMERLEAFFSRKDKAK